MVSARVLLWCCWLVAVPSLLLTLLIVARAPIYQLWLVAVGVSEWSLWFVLLGIVGLLCGLLAARRGQTAAALFPMLLSLIVIVLALLPIVTAQEVANRVGVRLSLVRYLTGWHSPVALTEQPDIPFTTVNGHTLKLDVYRPAAPARQPVPAILVIHGGSWSGGTKSDFPQYDRWLAAGGRVVFDVEYRLSGTNDNRFPAAVADVKCAIGWVRQNAVAYGVDPSRIALLGRSAGGQLALLAAYTPNDPALPPACPAADTAVSAVISFYGPTDLVWGYTHPAHPDVINGPQTLETYLGGSPTTAPATYALAAPFEHVGAATPPTLLFHGGHDQLVGHQHAEHLVARLTSHGRPFGYTYLPWANHGFDFNFNGWGSQIAQGQIEAFLASYLQ